MSANRICSGAGVLEVGAPPNPEMVGRQDSNVRPSDPRGGSDNGGGVSPPNQRSMPAERSSSSAARRTTEFRRDRAVVRGRIVPFLLGALLTAAPAAAGGPDVDATARAQKTGAQQTFDAGSRLYDSKRYREALTAF